MPQIESLLLANHAEAVNGLLYMMGAGWTDLRLTGPAGTPLPPHHFGVGVTVLVPWGETNRRHRLGIVIEREDGEVLARIDGDIETGRPPGLPAGSDQRAVLALNADIQFPGPGGYRVVAAIGESHRSVSFRVQQQAHMSAA